LRLRRRDGMIPACHDRRGNPITPFDLYYEDTEVFGSASPHFGGMVASALVAAYLCSGETNYLEAARLITNRLIEHMPDFSDVSRNCKSHAYARMLVPLAFLYRADGSRRWLDLAAEVDNYLADKQADCGAIYEWDHWDIREFRGDTGIFHENGEKIADLLYTNNFVLLNSWFAWKSTGEQRYLERFERVADFLMSIQIQSNDPKIDGGWMRGFDFGPQWDWYGSNQDTSWGPYAMETGWTNAPISMAFSMYVLDLDPFDLLCG